MHLFKKTLLRCKDSNDSIKQFSIQPHPNVELCMGEPCMSLPI